MFCSKCGNTLKPDARFCNKCGQKLKNSDIKTTDKPTSEENIKAVENVLSNSETSMEASTENPMEATSKNPTETLTEALTETSPETEPTATPKELSAPSANHADTDPNHVSIPIPVAETDLTSVPVVDPVSIPATDPAPDSVSIPATVPSSASAAIETNKTVAPKPKINKLLIVIPIVLLFLFSVGTSFGFVVLNKIKPAFKSSMDDTSIENYLSNQKNYSFTADHEILVTLDSDLINQLLFETISGQQQNPDIKIHSLRYNPKNDKIQLDANYKWIHMEINYTANLTFAAIEDQVVMSFNGGSPRFGQDNFNIAFLSNLLPDGLCQGSVTLPGLAQVTKLKEAEKDDDALVLVLRPDNTALQKILTAMTPYIDTSYISISDNPSVELEKAFLDPALTQEELVRLLYCYTDEGIHYLSDNIFLFKAFMSPDFSSQMRAYKDELFEAHDLELEEYVRLMMGNLYDYYDGYDAIKTNGHVYSSFYSPTQIQASDLIVYTQKPPSHLDLEKMDLIYNRDTDLIGLSYLKNTDTYKVVFEDDSILEYGLDEYEKLYGVAVLPKGELQIPLPGDAQRTAIIKGIKSYDNLSEDISFFVRYMRCDDRYAFAIVSPTNDYQRYTGYLMTKNDAGTWEGVGVFETISEFESLLTDSDYIDMNINMFPKQDITSYQIDYLNDETLSILYEVFIAPLLPENEVNKIDFAAAYDGYVYIRLDTPKGQQYVITSWGDVYEVRNYQHFLELVKENGIPIHIALQIN